jgi:glycerol kinase
MTGFVPAKSASALLERRSNRMADLLLAIDQGTTGTTAMVIDRRGRVRGRSYGEIRQYYPKPGWVEHDPEEIYNSAVSLARKAVRQAGAAAEDLAGVGITNQRETFVVWERKTGRPVHRAIVWQCRRSAEICRRLAAYEPEIARRTGLLIDPYFSGTKLKWLLDERPELRRRAARGELCFGTIETWLIFKLSQGAAFVTDYTNASRTMLFNLERRVWDEEILRILDVPREMLPGAISSRGPFAETAPGTIARRAIPLAAAIGDQQSALFGQGAVRPGDSKATYGTGAFLLVHTGTQRIVSQRRMLTTVALGPEGEPAYALEGSVFVAGAAIQWLRDGLGIIESASDTLRMARRSRDRTHPYLVPAFVGLGAPYWDSEARGAIVGITRGTSREDIVRAALDSIAYQVHDVIVAMESDIGRKISELRVDGGATANPYLMQFQADLLARTVRRPKIAETTALGAAMLAGLATGVWRRAAHLEALRKGGTVFRPRMRTEERARLLEGWRDAVSRTLTRCA